MGLDLILYKKKKNLEQMSMEEELDSELAYGRKTWAIANFFTSRCEAIDYDWYYKVTKDVWDEFISSLDKLKDPDFRLKVESFIYYRGDSYDEAHIKDYDEIESWLNGALNNDAPYYLGLEWELAAVLIWFDADDEVQKAFEEGFEVELIQSY